MLASDPRVSYTREMCTNGTWGQEIMKAKKLADYCGYWDDYNNFGSGINHGEINFDGDKLKSTREIYEGKDCIVSRITDKNGDIRISQIEYPLIYAEDEDQEHKKKMDKIISEF